MLADERLEGRMCRGRVALTNLRFVEFLQRFRLTLDFLRGQVAVLVERAPLAHRFSEARRPDVEKRLDLEGLRHHELHVARAGLLPRICPDEALDRDAVHLELVGLMQFVHPLLLELVVLLEELDQLVRRLLGEGLNCLRPLTRDLVRNDVEVVGRVVARSEEEADPDLARFISVHEGEGSFRGLALLAAHDTDILGKLEKQFTRLHGGSFCLMQEVGFMHRIDSKTLRTCRTNISSVKWEDFQKMARKSRYFFECSSIFSEEL